MSTGENNENGNLQRNLNNISTNGYSVIIIIMFIVYICSIVYFMAKPNITIDFKTTVTDSLKGDVENEKKQNIEIDLTKNNQDAIKEALSGSDSIQNMVGVTAIFFTALVVTVNLFQFIKTKQVDELKEELKKSREDMEEYKKEMKDYIIKSTKYMEDDINIMRFDNYLKLLDSITYKTNTFHQYWGTLVYREKVDDCINILKKCEKILDDKPRIDIKKESENQVYIKFAEIYSAIMEDYTYSDSEVDKYRDKAIKYYEKSLEYREDSNFSSARNLVPLYYKKKNFGRCLELIRDMNNDDPEKTINENTFRIICKDSTKRYWHNYLSVDEKKHIIEIIKEPKELFINAISGYINSVKKENKEIDKELDKEIIEYIMNIDDKFKDIINKSLDS